MNQMAPITIDVPEDVRLATEADRMGLIDLCHMLHGENGLFPLSPSKLDRMIDAAFNREGAIIGVIGDMGRPVASIYLAIQQFVYSDAWALMEEWNFVHPEHRRSRHARNLITYAKFCSDQLRMPLMTGILSNHRTEAKARLYDQQLERAGYYFIYNRHFAGSGAWDQH